MTSSHPRPPEVPDPKEQHRRPERRIVVVSFAIALVLHLAVVLFYPWMMGRLFPEDTAFDPDAQPRFRNVPEVVLLREILSPPEELEPDEPEEEEPEAEEVAGPVEPAEPEEPEAAPEAEGEGERPTAAERLRPRMGDARLWVPLDPDVGALTPEERAELMLRGLIQDWNDSVAIAEAVAEAGLDWTVTDEDGKRWGVSPGRLHLGTFSIPLPFEFSAPGYLREDQAFRRWQWEEIRRGAASQEIRETWAERAREIRRRMDAQRDSTQIRR